MVTTKPMKKILLTILLALIAYFMYSMMTVAYVEEKPIVIIQEVEKKDRLHIRQRAWLGALIWCESRGIETAINPVDLDNTPSYGLLQFKPSTFHYFMARYEIGTSTNYMDAELQQRIVEEMILRNDVKWHIQFPGCTKKLGTPPIINSLY